MIRDAADVNQRLRPDVVILDEAQRIKNWNTQTARAIKRLESRYAFLLTGTPIENRIDEIYSSIIDYIDPQVFGPLFRFNRTFYELDERGRPVGYQNLDELRRRLRPLLLRRRKDQIESQLPERVDNNYFVPMSAAQLIARRMPRTTAGSTAKAPLAHPAPEPGVQHCAQMSLVEVLAHDPLGDLDPAPRVAFAEQPAAREHSMAEERRCVLEHHDVHRVGTEARARISDQIEPLAPACTRLEPAPERDCEVDV